MAKDTASLADGSVLALGPDDTVFLRSASALAKVKAPDPALVEFLKSLGGRVDRHVEIPASSELRAALTALGVLRYDNQPAQALGSAARRFVVSKLAPLGPLAVVDDYRSAATERLVRSAKSEGQPILLARLRGRPVVGPLFDAQDKVCVRCFFATVQTNDVDTALATATTGADLRVDPPLDSASADRFLAFVDRLSDTDLTLLTNDAVLLVDHDRSTVVHLGGWPICPECRTVASSISCDAEFGRVRSVDVASVHSLVHVARATFALSHRPRGLVGGAAVRYWQASAAEGKGSSPEAAAASALAEVAERASGCFDATTAVTWCRYSEVKDRAVDPAALLLWSPAQYAAGAAAVSPHNRIPDPWDPDLVIPWVDSVEIGSSTRRLLPADYVYTNAHAVLGLTGRSPFVATSNGCAAGRTVDEAFERGLLELAERDAVAVWWYNRVTRPEVRGIAGDEVIDSVRAAFARAARDLWFLDLTHDLGVATVAAVAPINGSIKAPSRVVLGFGSGWRLSDAARRAALEAAQFLPRLGQFDAAAARLEPDTQRWWSGVRIAHDTWLVPDPVASRADPSSSSPDLLLARLAELGLDVLIVDQTRHWFDLAVVRVVVPGLRHFWRQLAPGRLYDVPVRLGWCAEPTPEDQLNRYDVFF